jgi:phosphoglycolate phosphatase-like HAD superfamily hydrolase
MGRQRGLSVHPRLVLFDIDGTLIRSGGAGMRTIAHAFRELFGDGVALPEVAPDGKTDPMILRELLAAAGLWDERGPERQRTLARMYRRGFAAQMARASGACLMPGVRQVLGRLHGLVPMGLLTGNFEPTARIKLDHFGIGELFPFGAFGSDDEVREHLVPIAVARAERHLGVPIGVGRQVVVVGDTPRDVACAVANGATALGVGAASYTAEELRRAGAHAVLEDLTDTDSVVEALGLPAEG